MGVQVVCTEGYPLVTCRCTKKHDPVSVNACPLKHHHSNLYTGSGPGSAKLKTPGPAPVETIEAYEWVVVSNNDYKGWDPQPSKQSAIVAMGALPEEANAKLRRRLVRTEKFDWENVL